MKRMKSQSGFSLMEVVVGLLAVGGLALAMGYGLALQKTQDVQMSSKLGLSSLLENVAHRVNSTDSAVSDFGAFRAYIEKNKDAVVLTTFDDCIQKRTTTGCLSFVDTTQYPSISKSETTEVSRGVTLQLDWVSSIQCDANTCSSMNRNVTATLKATDQKIEQSNEFKLMQSQVARMAVSSQRNFPILNLVQKRDMDYVCASDPNGPPVVGLNPDNAVAKCAPLSGKRECASVGSRPLAAFGGEYAKCESLVSVGCGKGISQGGYFDGACKADTSGSLSTYLKKDASGLITSVTVCGPGGCIAIAKSTYGSPTNDILGELQKSPQYSQLISTWKNEGVLLPMDTIGISDSSFDAKYGKQLDGATGVTITTTSSAPSGATVVDGALGTSGTPSVDPSIF